MLFAKINYLNIVTQVICADEEFVSTLPGQWVPVDPNGVSPKNVAGIGYKFDVNNNAFIPPQPFPSWILNTSIFQWEPPIPYPNDGNYYQWDETNQIWNLVGTQ